MGGPFVKGECDLRQKYSPTTNSGDLSWSEFSGKHGVSISTVRLPHSGIPFPFSDGVGDSELCDSQDSCHILPRPLQLPLRTHAATVHNDNALSNEVVDFFTPFHSLQITVPTLQVRLS